MPINDQRISKTLSLWLRHKLELAGLTLDSTDWVDGRHHVHLSPDVEAARKVGARRGDPVILIVEAARLAADGRAFSSTSGPTADYTARGPQPHGCQVYD